MKILTPGDALLADIIATPGDDTPRLIYADWLEDDGRPERADFIHVQVELARFEAENPCVCGEGPDPTGCWRCREVWWRKKTIATQFFYQAYGHRDNVTHFHDDPYRLLGLAGYAGPSVEWDWHRGFVREVRCPLKFLIQRGAVVARVHPVERVLVTDRRPEVRTPNHPPEASDCYWRKDDGGWDAAVATSLLSPPLFLAVSSHAKCLCVGSVTCWFASETDAVDALSDSLISAVRTEQ